MKNYLFALNQKIRLHNFSKLNKSVDSLSTNDIINLEEKAYLNRNRTIEDAIEELENFGMADYDEGDAREIYETLDKFPGEYQSDYVFYDLSEDDEPCLNDLPIKGKWDLEVYNTDNSSRAAYLNWLCGIAKDVKCDLLQR